MVDGSHELYKQTNLLVRVYWNQEPEFFGYRDYVTEKGDPCQKYLVVKDNHQWLGTPQLLCAEMEHYLVTVLRFYYSLQQDDLESHDEDLYIIQS